MKKKFIYLLFFVFILGFSQEKTKKKNDSIQIVGLESVTIGYGSKKKADITGSIVSIKSEDLISQPNGNALNSLQGKASGVQIINAGSPGESPVVRIRGIGSSSETPPLFVVDGVWMNDISSINPNDIESVSVLKDASSSAIYGIRAAKGVIIIKTISGKKNQKLKINLDHYTGIQSLIKNFDMTSRDQYIELYNELNPNNLKNPNDYADVDWFKEISKSAMIQNTAIGIFGGSEYSTYNLNIGYFNQDGVIKGSDYQRYTVRFGNINNLSKSIRIGIDFNANLSKTNNMTNGVLGQAYFAPPIINPYNEKGEFQGFDNAGVGNFSNPLASIHYNNDLSKTRGIVGQIFAELDILKNLTFKTSFGGEYSNFYRKKYEPKYFVSSYQRTDISKLTKLLGTTENWQLENTLSYKVNFAKKHNLSLLLGQGTYEKYFSYLAGYAENVPDEKQSNWYLSLGNTGSRTVYDADLRNPWSQTPARVRQLSYFGRMSYDYDGKYLLTATLRRDGSSDFSKDKRFEYFPSLGLGWVISNENFLKDSQSINFLKLRGSWGKMGNADVPNQSYALTTSFNNFVGGNGGIFNGTTINKIVPKQLSWEFIEEFDAGIETKFLRKRLGIEADFYSRTTHDAIFSKILTGQIGSEKQEEFGNFASFKNQGIELGITWNDNPTENFKYEISANFTYNKNTVTKLKDNIPIYGASVANGQMATLTTIRKPIGSFFGYDVLGIDPQGKMIFRDVNNDGSYDELDKIDLGSPHPKYMYSLNLGFQYKNFDFATEFFGLADFKIYNGKRTQRYGAENWDLNYYENRKTQQNPNGKYPSANNFVSVNPNSLLVENGDFLKIRSIQIGYNFPKNTLESLGINKLRFYCNVQNVITFTKYNGFTPEISSPNPIITNLDQDVYPQSRTYNLGFNVTF